jgi:spore coat polysaccharide biosynthesis protein SpsF
MRTEQEDFWAGEFGTEYITRNTGDDWIANNTAHFATILRRTSGITTVIELGANIGLNLQAIRRLLPSVELTGIEINADAAKELHNANITAIHGSLLDVDPPVCDLSFTKGVLIHINPDSLPIAYEKLYQASRRYILVCEYYNPSPVAIPYRGHTDRLFKRDFAGELLDRFADLRLIDYGFIYQRDPNWPQDDQTWFLLEKK